MLSIFGKMSAHTRYNRARDKILESLEITLSEAVRASTLEPRPSGLNLWRSRLASVFVASKFVWEPGAIQWATLVPFGWNFGSDNVSSFRFSNCDSLLCVFLAFGSLYGYCHANWRRQNVRAHCKISHEWHGTRPHHDVPNRDRSHFFPPEFGGARMVCAQRASRIYIWICEYADPFNETHKTKYEQWNAIFAFRRHRR